jgi:hypothetical protein
MYGGHGDIDISVPDTRNIFLEPGKLEVSGSNYFYEVSHVDQLSLLRQHPDMRDEVNKLFSRQGSRVGGMLKKLTSTRKQTGIERHTSAPGAAEDTTSTNFFELAADLKNSNRKMVELVEQWFHDDTTMEVTIQSVGDKGKLKPVKSQRKKFPDGKVVQFSGKFIFLEKENKFPGFPYVEYWNYFLPGLPYGMSELRQLVSIQHQINVRKNQVYDGMNKGVFPRVFVDRRAGIDLENLSNVPGEHVPCRDVSGVLFEPAPRMNQATFLLQQNDRKDFETVSGVREVTQGTIPGDIRSGAAIEALQEAADIRLRGKSGSLESTVRDLVRLTILLIVRFYRHGEHYRWSERMVEMPDGQEIPLTETDEFKEFMETKKLHPDFFEIEIQAGVNLPRSRSARRELLLQLFDRKIIDAEYLINHIQIEDKDELRTRMKPVWDAAREAELAQLEQAAVPEQDQGAPPQQGGQAIGNAF